jgi:Zn-finger nucleic acid-binding protein
VDCPNCGRALEESELDHIAVHDCPACRGIWFERDELRDAKDNADPNLRWLDFDVFKAADTTSRQPDKPCPHCGQAMNVLAYPHSKVKIDVCEADHGVWLDRGEFDELIKTLEHVANSMSARELGSARE